MPASVRALPYASPGAHKGSGQSCPTDTAHKYNLLFYMVILFIRRGFGRRLHCVDLPGVCVREVSLNRAIEWVLQRSGVLVSDPKGGGHGSSDWAFHQAWNMSTDHRNSE
jgi:hypothetical protein